MIISGDPELPNNSVKPCRAALRAANVIVSTCSVPEHLERPAVVTEVKQAAQR